jgi:hypothetical protein
MNAVQLEDGLDEIVEISTFIRERPVACRWSSGVVTGDAELLGRLSQTTAGRNWAERPSSVASAVSAAVGSPVTIRVLDELEVDLTDDEPGAEAATHDVLGDYWLG